MRVATDAQSVSLMRSMRPFLSERGQAAIDDLLGAVNLLSIFDSLGDVVKKRRGVGNERPLAFLSNLAYMDVDPKTVAKAVSNMMDMPSQNKPETGKIQDQAEGTFGSPKPEDITRLMQTVMSRAANDPNFAAALGSLAEEGMRSDVIPKLISVLGPDFMPKTDKPSE